MKSGSYNNFKSEPFSQSNIILLLLVFVSAAFFYLYDIGQQSIRYSDEATHVRVIQEMLASGDYLNPTLDGVPYLNKPPLKMWLTIGVISVLGESNFSYRLIDGLCSAAIVTLVLLLGLNIFKRRLPALISAFCLIGSHGYFVTARQNTATQDAFVVFCNTLALTCAYFLLANPRSRFRFLLSVVFGFSIAAGVLTKSVVGVVPLIILLPVIIFCRREIFRNLKPFLQSGLIAATCAAIPVVIYYAQLFSRIPDAWARVFGYDIKERLITEGFHNSAKWWFYLERLFIDQDFVPAWILALSFLGTVFLLVLKKNLNSVFIFCWAFLPLVLFSILQSRAFHYIAPAFPAFALGIGQLFLFTGNRISRIVLALVFSGLLINFFHAGQRIVREERKLPVERMMYEIRQIPDLKNILTKDLDLYLQGDTYQRWRQQFYLDIISRKRQELTSEVQENSLVIANWPSALELLKNNALRQKVCGYWPLWKPAAKRQSMGSVYGKDPEAVALLFTDCSRISDYSMPDFISLKSSLDFSSYNQLLYGLEKGKKSEIKSVMSPYFALSFMADPISRNFSSRLVFHAAVSGQDYSKQKLLVMLNGEALPVLEIGGAQLREYGLKIPSGLLDNKNNLLTVFQQTDKNQARINLRAVSLRIE